MWLPFLFVLTLYFSAFIIVDKVFLTGAVFIEAGGIKKRMTGESYDF